MKATVSRKLEYVGLVGVLPAGLDGVVDRSAWSPGPRFDLVAGRARDEPMEMERTFSMGVGMIALVGVHPR